MTHPATQILANEAPGVISLRLSLKPYAAMFTFFNAKSANRELAGLEKEMKEQQKKVEQEADNKRFVELFDAFAALPICVPVKDVDRQDRALINPINGMLLTFHASSDGPTKIRTRALPHDMERTYSYINLSLEEAENIFKLWAIMAKPYYISDWNIPDEKVAESNATSV